LSPVLAAGWAWDSTRDMSVAMDRDREEREKRRDCGKRVGGKTRETKEERIERERGKEVGGKEKEREE